MIDVLFKTYLVKKNPIYGVLVGSLFVIIGLGFSLLIFHEDLSFPVIFLTTLAAAPVVIKLIEDEKWK